MYPLRLLFVGDFRMEGESNPPRIVGRATAGHHPNRFERVRLEDDREQLEYEEQPRERRVETLLLPDASQTIIRENDSPDIPFRYSINPYRGCEHGCSYCYARPTHETLGLDAALDFETKIMVKYDAAKLLRAELNRPRWQGEQITISGVTDCYQPAERELKITRGLLEVMLEARQPLSIVTKNALVVRDLDLLAPLAAMNLVHVNISLTSLDAELLRTMEPRTSSPTARLRAMRELTSAGVPTRVMCAPVIPGLTDEAIPSVLAAASEAGAQAAGFVLLRLPYAVKPIFLAWLEKHYPLKRERVQGLIESTRGGKLNDARFGTRMRGEGNYAKQIEQTFRVFAHKFGLDKRLPELDSSQFVPPRPANGQQRLF
jgi:DNA repair photolyase